MTPHHYDKARGMETLIGIVGLDSRASVQGMPFATRSFNGCYLFDIIAS